MVMAFDAVAYVWEFIGWVAAACFWGIVGYLGWIFWKGGK